MVDAAIHRPDSRRLPPTPFRTPGHAPFRVKQSLASLTTRSSMGKVSVALKALSHPIGNRQEACRFMPCIPVAGR